MAAMIRYHLVGIIHLLFNTYTFLLFARIIISWIPAWSHQKWVRFISFYTDPFLNLFRRILPPIGGTIDLSPILAFFVLRMLETVLLQLIL